MLKLRAFCLFLLFVFMQIYEAEAKVCFLPGVLSGDGCLTETKVGCEGFDRTAPCLSGYIQISCVADGKTYYKCSCDKSNNKMHNEDVDGVMYYCSKDYDEECGCASQDTYCKEELYPYTSCDEFEGSEPDTSTVCINPANGVVHYKACNCSNSVYPFSCMEKGLKVSSLAPKCVSSYGEKLYEFCDCAAGWSSVMCSSNQAGCSVQIDSAYRGNDMGYCYLCGEETCELSTDTNLNSVYCTVAQNINVDCLTLGYIYDEDGLCSDGSAGLKCAFDSKYIYCE